MFFQFSCSVVSDSLWPHGLQHARIPYPSPIPEACSNSHPSSRWCHPTISSSVAPFSSYLQSSQHQGFFQWVSSSHQVTKYWSIGHVLYLHAMLNLHFICMSVYGLYSFPLTCLYSFHTTLIKSLTVNLYRLSTPSPPPSITYFFRLSWLFLTLCSFVHIYVRNNLSSYMKKLVEIWLK